MIRKFVQTVLIICVILLSVGITPFLQTQTMKVTVVKADSESPLINIEEVNLEVEKEGEFQILEALIIEQPTTGDEIILPNLLNKSKIRLNATYSTVIGNSEEIVIHDFTVEVHKEILAEGENETTNQFRVGFSTYRNIEPEELILKPNSSISEVITIPSLALPEYTTYKFVFSVQYHIFKGDEISKKSYFDRNMSFELVKSLPEPPYIIIGIFYSLFFILIALVLLGVYGNRKYKDSES